MGASSEPSQLNGPRPRRRVPARPLRDGLEVMVVPSPARTISTRATALFGRRAAARIVGIAPSNRVRQKEVVRTSAPLTAPMSTDDPESTLVPTLASQSGIWTLVANVLMVRPYGVGGLKTYRGTRHFAPGAKVFVVAAFWGMGAESVIAIGHHRKSKRYIHIAMKSAHLTNWRVELIRSPTVLALAQRGRFGGSSATTSASRDRLEPIAASFAAHSVPQPPTTRPPHSVLEEYPSRSSAD